MKDSKWDKIVLKNRIAKKKKTRVGTTVIKPGPAGRPGGWTGSGLIKDRLWQQPGQTRANPDKTQFFFF